MSNKIPPGRYPCVACGAPVRRNASHCPHCSARQKPTWSLRRIVAVASVVVTLLSLALAIEKLFSVYQTWRETERRVQEHLASVDSLVAVGDYKSAWDALEQAHRADPNSARVRTVQVEVATAWIIDGQPLPIGWYPSKSASAADPAISPGKSAAIVSHALALADAYAGDWTDADLLALTIWAQYLRSRELITQRRNFAPDLKRALERNPESHLANLLIGYWLAVMERDLRAAWPHWERALTGGEETARTRRFQVVAFGQALRNRQEDLRNLASSMLITVLNDIRNENEPMPDMLRSDWLTLIWLDRRNRFDLPDRWKPMPSPAEQLDTLDWLKDKFEFSKYSTQPARLQFIRARLLEETGQQEKAIAAYKAVDLARAGHKLALLFEQAVERLTGEPSPDALVHDQWRRYTYYVSTMEPGSENFEEAVTVIRDEAGMVLGYGDPTMRGRFPPALDAAIGSLSRWTEQSDSTDTRQQLKELLVARGRLRNRLSDYNNALRDLEPIAVDPEVSQGMRAPVWAYIAEVFADRSRRRERSPEGDVLRKADIREGFDRLQAAVTEGFDDWDWIESKLSPLRSLPEYVTFSVRQGRLPPQDKKDK